MELLVTEAASTAHGRLQAAGTQLHDVRAKKDQLAARIREAQAMLAMDTGLWLIPGPVAPLCPVVPCEIRHIHNGGW